MTHAWVWLIVIPIWIGCVVLVALSARLHLKAFRVERQGKWQKATDLYYQVIGRNLVVVGLVLLSVVVIQVADLVGAL